MSSMTIERIRLTFDVPDRVRRALNIVAARRVCSVGDIIAELTEEAYPDALADAGSAHLEEFARY